MRMARVLCDNRCIGITDLALLARINHQRCLVNIQWMERKGIVQVSTINNRKEVIVTDAGIDYLKRLASVPVLLNMSSEDDAVYNTVASTIEG